MKTALTTKAKGCLSHWGKTQLLKFVSGNHDKTIRGECVFCGEPDSQKHRLVHCQAEEVQEVRDKQWGKGQVRKWLQEAKEQPLGRDKGWFGRRKPGWRATKEVWYCEPLFVEGETFFLPDLPIYVDGSCFFPTEDEVRAAGAAAVQVKDGGGRKKHVCPTA